MWPRYDKGKPLAREDGAGAPGQTGDPLQPKILLACFLQFPFVPLFLASLYFSFAEFQ